MCQSQPTYKQERSRGAEPIHGARCHEQSLGRIKTSGDANDGPFDLCCLQTGHQALNLDVVSLVAVLLQFCRIGWHERKPFDDSLQLNGMIWRVEPEGD